MAVLWFIWHSVRLIFFLLVSGTSSTVERALLATTQQRQSPANASMFGLANFVLDGIKLFSKSVFTSHPASSALFGVGILVVVCHLTDLSFSVSGIVGIVQFQLSTWLVVGIVEVFSLSTFSSSQNSYVNLSLLRLIEIFVVAEITTGLALIFVFLDKIAGKSSSTLHQSLDTWTTFLILLVVLVPLLAFSLEKVPFDLVEAESELIDGVTTEFSGFVFSSVYAIEVATAFVTLKVLLVVCTFISLIVLCFLILSAYVGRVFLTRFLTTDAIEFMLAIGLASTSAIVVVAHLWIWLNVQKG